MTLHEGKNREIRKVLAHFGLEVSRPFAYPYPISLGNLKKAEIKEVGRKELASAFGIGPEPSQGPAGPKPRPTRPGQRRKTINKKQTQSGPAPTWQIGQAV